MEESIKDLSRQVLWVLVSGARSARNEMVFSKPSRVVIGAHGAADWVLQVPEFPGYQLMVDWDGQVMRALGSDQKWYEVPKDTEINFQGVVFSWGETTASPFDDATVMDPRAGQSTSSGHSPHPEWVDSEESTEVFSESKATPLQIQSEAAVTASKHPNPATHSIPDREVDATRILPELEHERRKLVASHMAESQHVVPATNVQQGTGAGTTISHGKRYPFGLSRGAFFAVAVLVPLVVFLFLWEPHPKGPSHANTNKPIPNNRPVTAIPEEESTPTATSERDEGPHARPLLNITQEGKSTMEREAAERLIGGKLQESLDYYQALVEAFPNHPEFERMVRILKRKLRCKEGACP